MKSKNKIILSIKNLETHYKNEGGLFKKPTKIHAVNGVNLDVFEGETLGLVGESGCGKSTLGRTVLGLEKSSTGQVLFNGIDVLKLKGNKLRQARKEFQIIFQDPYSSLNPKMKIGEIVMEPLLNFEKVSKKEAEGRVKELMIEVGLPESSYYKYPHEFSGGQRQRVAIAKSLINKPRFIVADEPVSALDVSIQSQILNLMKDLQKKYNLTYLFISHDLSVVKHMSDRIAIMYLGEVVEITDKDELYKNPLHPYTQALISAIPEVNLGGKKERIILKGDVPDPANPPKGCPFASRCMHVSETCLTVKPSLKEVVQKHNVSCHLYND